MGARITTVGDHSVCLCLTNLGSLWIVFLGIVYEGRHVVVQISLETVDQVSACTVQRVRDKTPPINNIEDLL